MFRSYQKCNTDYLENGPKTECRFNLIYMTIFIPQKFRRQRNIREIGSGIKRSLPPCFYSMPDIFCFQILLFRMRRGTPDKELRNAGISEWFFQIPADASKVEGH